MLYTDGNYLIADSDRELQQFVREANLTELTYNAAAYIPYYQIKQKHLATVIEAGALAVDPIRLRGIAQQIQQGKRQ